MSLKLAGELWTRLTCFACVAALLIQGLCILAEIDGWLAYETARQISEEIGARVAIGLTAALVASTAVTLLALPYLFWNRADAARRLARIATVTAVSFTLICVCILLGIAILWAQAVHLLTLTNRGAIRLWALLALVLLATILAVCLTARRRVLTHRLTQTISGSATRRLLLLAGIAGLLTGLSSEVFPRPSFPRPRRTGAARGRPNLLLVTFDALCAEDMSCYGYHLPTTPNIDALARSSCLFSNYYSASTFTTPSVVAMLTGRYPTTTHVYHYGGNLRGADVERTLPRMLRDAGYATAASVGNPGAHPGCLGFGHQFDVLPSCPLRDFPTREAAALFHSAQLAADVGRGGNFVPYMLEQLSPKLFGQVHSRFPPAASFAQAEQILQNLPRPYFLWVHVFAPHFPYLPEPPWLHRFLASDELRTHAEFADMVDRTGYLYSPAKQPAVDKGRLRYDEWVAQADAAFGEFLTRLQRRDGLADTALIVSADHGESFQGGFLGHGGAEQLRPILHIPLIVKLPGQNQHRDIALSADQTALAPAMLQLAGLARPEWMDGRSLLIGNEGESGAAGGHAFSQFLVPNSSFKPVSHGSIGVIDGQHQYVYNFDRRAGALFDLAEAHEQKHELAAQQPELTRGLHERLLAQFPNVFGADSGRA